MIKLLILQMQTEEQAASFYKMCSFC